MPFCIDFLVAWDGIEPPTRGFSVLILSFIEFL